VSDSTGQQEAAMGGDGYGETTGNRDPFRGDSAANSDQG
jgi:hypothetical protein